MTDLIPNKTGFIGPTFSLSNRFRRTARQVAWLLFARWTPPPFHKLRIALLRLFGAKISYKAYVYPDVKIWAPWNLEMDEYSTLARGVICYNIGAIKIGNKAVISQSVHLCTGTHDYRNPSFPLFSRPITICASAWICADAFIGPGVTVGEGAILAAAGVTHNDLIAWIIYSGNPATILKARSPMYKL